MSKKVIKLDKYRSKDKLQQMFKDLVIDVHEQTVEMYKKSMINYEQYKTLMNRLTELVNDKGDKK